MSNHDHKWEIEDYELSRTKIKASALNYIQNNKGKKKETGIWITI